MTIIVFDTETTSLLAASAAPLQFQPYLIDLYAVKLSVDFKIIDTLSIRMKPPIMIPPEASKINGIYDKDVKECLPFTFYFPQIVGFFLGGIVCVGHNLLYDKMVLWCELSRIGKQMNFPWSVRDIDTVEICQQQLGHRLNLTDMHTWLFDTGFDDAHTADADCKITLKCLVEMVSRGMVIL